MRSIHVTADGRRLLVLHGDVFDAVVKHARWLAMLGDERIRPPALAQSLFQHGAAPLGYQYWSLSAYLKHRVKNAMQYIGSLRRRRGHEANRRGVDGVVCGHIHHAEIREMNGVLYCNDGDWVEAAPPSSSISSVIAIWSGGVDTALFRPDCPPPAVQLSRPVLLTLGG